MSNTYEVASSLIDHISKKYLNGKNKKHQYIYEIVSEQIVGRLMDKPFEDPYDIISWYHLKLIMDRKMLTGKENIEIYTIKILMVEELLEHIY